MIDIFPVDRSQTTASSFIAKDLAKTCCPYWRGNLVALRTLRSNNKVEVKLGE